MQLRAHDLSMAGADLTPSLLQMLVDDVTLLLMLTNEQLCSLPSELRPLSQYLFKIACACMTSMALCVADDPDGAQRGGVQYGILQADGGGVGGVLLLISNGVGVMFTSLIGCVGYYPR